MKDVPIKSVSMSPSIFLSSAAKIFQRTFGFPKVRAEDACDAMSCLGMMIVWLHIVYLPKENLCTAAVSSSFTTSSISGKIQFTPLDGGAAVVKRKEKDACESIKA